MSGFEELHPVVQHHIVNSLGWKSLRPFQDEVIPEILSGKHMVIIAPTAGGKTEAAFFPTASRILSERWPGLSVLYLCPLKALLNNLSVRLERYANLLGLKTALWHGDISQSDRRKILQGNPHTLLTTPESLEVMLLSNRVNHKQLFSNVRVVIVDEIHAFAGDDRGWHLLSVLSRISRFAGRELQRIGLSATVGNPETLCDWLTGGCHGERRVYSPPEASSVTAAVTVDFVGSEDNAATVISRLHRGQKRLVFVDSRSGVEELGSRLRNLSIQTSLTHSSLSQEQRRDAEAAFSSGSDCVIVATSVLELGVDVGDLDKVVQVNSPGTVAGFLQRMGRTGRRAGTERNCLFLAIDNQSLLTAAGLVELWKQGFVESVTPPPLPLHILAQQIMALALQQRGVTQQSVRQWLDRVPAFSGLDPERMESLISWMVKQDLLWDDNGLLWFGKRGESTYGRRNFLTLFSVFLTPPVFEVMHGRHHIGSVDEFTFLTRPQGPGMILLGGRTWQVHHIEWSRKVAYVEPVQDKGIAQWPGNARPMSARLARMLRTILCGSSRSACWSQRATERIFRLREQYPWLVENTTTILKDNAGGVVWYTFAGTLANMALASSLQELTHSPVKQDAISITIDGVSTVENLINAIEQLRATPPECIKPKIDQRAIRGLKFSECLDPKIAEDVLTARYADRMAIQTCLHEEVRLLVSEKSAACGFDFFS